MKRTKPIKVIELFAGVGGFRLGLERAQKELPNCCGYDVVWANQWEPPGTARKQFAYDCYVERFDKSRSCPTSHSNEDIAEVLNKVEAGAYKLPAADMVVGGFPCQDYSVAKPLSKAEGIHGKKGVLWWEIFRLLSLAPEKPRYLLLENVDRMLKSPASQRGRDFAVMLSCLASLGYSVEWRVVNASEYGQPQRRRRVFIYAEQTKRQWNLVDRLSSKGILAHALPILPMPENEISTFDIGCKPYEVSENFGVGDKLSRFLIAGVMQNGVVGTAAVTPNYDGPFIYLKDILDCSDSVGPEFYVAEDKLDRWKYFKGSKKEPRVDKKTGHEYMYAEGSMAFPDSLDRPARTILTGEGGNSASRFKHIIEPEPGVYRRLTPNELEALNCFPKGWTDTGMSANNRAFCMGNALVVGIVEKIAKTILEST